nr:MAG TPA: hypothetical protein [Caudoviricetes sp.]
MFLIVILLLVLIVVTAKPSLIMPAIDYVESLLKGRKTEMDDEHIEEDYHAVLQERLSVLLGNVARDLKNIDSKLLGQISDMFEAYEAMDFKRMESLLSATTPMSLSSEPASYGHLDINDYINMKVLSLIGGRSSKNACEDMQIIWSTEFYKLVSWVVCLDLKEYDMARDNMKECVETLKSNSIVKQFGKPTKVETPATEVANEDEEKKDEVTEAGEVQN